MKKIAFLYFVLGINTLFAQNLSQQADSLTQIGNNQAAIKKYQEILYFSDIQKKEEQILPTKISLCELLLQEANFDEIIQLLENHTHQATQEQKAQALNILGMAYLNKGRNDKAEQAFSDALAIFSQVQGQENEQVALCLNNLALVFWNTGNNELALEYLQKALSIREKIYGKKHPKVADVYNNIGLCLGQNQEALDYYQKSLAIYEQVYGQESPKLANTYNNLAIIERENKQYFEAIVFFEKALKIWQKTYTKNHPNEAFIYTNIRQIHFVEQNYELALEYQQKALNIYQQNYGKKHPEIASVYYLMSNIFLAQRKYPQALENIQKALIANVMDFEQQQITQNPQAKNYYKAELLAVSLLQKAQILESQHLNKSLKIRDLQNAIKAIQAADQLLDHIRSLRNNLKDRLALGNLAEQIYQTGIRISAQLAEYSPKKRPHWQRIFYFMEKNKAIALLAALADTKAKHFADIPDELLEEEKQLQTNITFYEKQLANQANQQHQDKLFELNRNYEKFIKNLETRFPKYYELKFQLPVIALDSLQKKLDRNSILLNYFIAQERIYILAIESKKVRFYDLPKAPNFESLTQKFRNSIFFHLPNIYKTTALKLHKQLIPKYLHAKRLIIIPDGVLNNLPFEAFLTQNTTHNDYKKMPYLLKKNTCSYAFSATLYAQNQNNKKDINKALLLAPVDFNALKLNNLPYSEQEIESIKTILEKKQIGISTFLYEQAQESVLKENDLKSYQILHLATHGKFDAQNPSLSQIFLHANSQDDGNLYAGEIYQLDLDAQMVVLSACQTALGKISKGEGVVGLSRALLYAGAKNIMVSQWAVADASTNELMVYFYEKLNNSQHYGTALREAKLKILAGEFAEPYFWAAFVLLGE